MTVSAAPLTVRAVKGFLLLCVRLLRESVFLNCRAEGLREQEWGGVHVHLRHDEPGQRQDCAPQAGLSPLPLARQ